MQNDPAKRFKPCSKIARDASFLEEDYILDDDDDMAPEFVAQKGASILACNQGLFGY